MQQNVANIPENLIYYYHPDHLGSSSFISDASGLASQHLEYFPFGETFVEENVGSFFTRYKFNAKEQDEESALYYCGARYYDPKTSVWLGVDPMADKYPGLSPFVYCANNPIKLIDPNGMTYEESDGSKKVAMKMAAKAEKLADKLDRKASRTKDADKKADFQARSAELRKSANEIHEMEANTNYVFRIVEGPENKTEPTSDPNHITIQYSGDIGDFFHENKHGYQAMDGQLDYVPDGQGGWDAGNLYGVNDEIAAWKAQYAYDGAINEPFVGAPPMADVYGRVNPNVQEINNMKNIDAGLINKMAKGRYGTDRSEHKYPIKAKGWNAN